MSKGFSIAVSELTIRDGYGRVSKKYRMLRNRDIINALLTIAESSREQHTKDNAHSVIRMINELNPNV